MVKEEETSPLSQNVISPLVTSGDELAISHRPDSSTKSVSDSPKDSVKDSPKNSGQPYLEMYEHGVKTSESSFSTFEIERRSYNFPLDVLRKVVRLLDFPTQLAAICVCKEWKEAGTDSIIFERISIPKSLACRLWDEEFEPLVRKAGGQLRVLQVSGSGITGKSLIALSQMRAMGPVVEELRFNRCSNLTGIDIVHFIEAITSRPESPHIKFLAIEGCGQLSHGNVVRLANRVDTLDVGICVCGRVEVLRKCESSSCQGLCQHCSEIYRDCGLQCGICNQPENSHQALRVRLHRWNLASTEPLRTRWKDVRYGLIQEE